jgi:hypothetical protein
LEESETIYAFIPYFTGLKLFVNNDLLHKQCSQIIQVVEKGFFPCSCHYIAVNLSNCATDGLPTLLTVLVGLLETS